MNDSFRGSRPIQHQVTEEENNKEEDPMKEIVENIFQRNILLLVEGIHQLLNRINFKINLKYILVISQNYKSKEKIQTFPREKKKPVYSLKNET